MILVDFNQCVIANVMAIAKRELSSANSSDEIIGLLRHVVLNTIKSYKLKHGKKFGDLVICCDSKRSWRKDVFPNYKANRKKTRDKSGIAWQPLYDALNLLTEEIEEYLPYRIISVSGAEGDDIISVLVHKFSLADNLIIASDKDFFQLQEKFSKTKQWCPRNKKFIYSNKKEFLEHIFKGDATDGIPNILSHDDVLVTEGMRQTPLRAERLEEFMEKGETACKNDTEKRNFHRNRTLIDFDYIPETISEAIEAKYTYASKNVNRDKMKLMNYLIKNGCGALVSDLGDF